MIIIADTEKLFYRHALETYFIGGLLIFLLGLLLGWILWRHCLAQAERVEVLNEMLSKRQSVLADKNRKLTKLVNKLPKEPKS